MEKKKEVVLDQGGRTEVFLVCEREKKHESFILLGKGMSREKKKEVVLDQGGSTEIFLVCEYICHMSGVLQKRVF